MDNEKFQCPDIDLTVIFSTSESILPGRTNITNMLQSKSKKILTRTIFDVYGEWEGGCEGRHQLFVIPLPEELKAHSTLEQSTTALIRWLRESHSPGFEQAYRTPSGSFQLIAVRLFELPTVRDSSSLESGRWPTSPRPSHSQTLFQQWAAAGSKWQMRSQDYQTSSPYSRKRRTIALSISSLCLLFLTLLIGGQLYLSSSTSTSSKFIQYEAGTSHGPRYTSLLPPSNVSAWVANHYSPTAYYWRIDEQALIPIELLDAQEARYQEYLAKRYPEKAEMRDSMAWADPAFLADPNNFMLPTDMAFHRGHCIRALRRYWQARETGKHVAPWDLDYLHIHHCVSMLEDLLYVEGPREVGEKVMSMSWRTKVVGWEPIDEIQP